MKKPSEPSHTLNGAVPAKTRGILRAISSVIITATLLVICHTAQAATFPTPTPTPPPSGSYEADQTQVTQTDDDPNDYFESSGSSGGGSISVDDEIAAGDLGQVWVSGNHSKSVNITYSWHWVSEDDMDPEPYTLTLTSEYSGDVTANATGSSSASVSGSYSDSLGLTGGVSNNNTSDTQTLTVAGSQQSGQATISAGISLTLGGNISLSAHQGEANGSLTQSSSVSVDLN